MFRSLIGYCARRWGQGALSLLALGVSCTSFAGGWGQLTSVTGYYVYDSGSAYMRTTHNENPDSCMYSGYLFLDPAAPHFKEIWATVMAAQATGSTVSLRYEGCSPDGYYPRVIAVAVPSVW